MRLLIVAVLVVCEYCVDFPVLFFVRCNLHVIPIMLKWRGGELGMDG